MMHHAVCSVVVRRPRRVAGGLLLGAACLSALSGARGEGAAASQSGKEYLLTKSSSFKAPPADSRNPFWPIGWTPGPVAAPTIQAAVMVYDVKPEQFALSTTSVDVPPLAIINGKSYTVRDQVPVPNSTEVVTVKSIQDGVVVLDHRGRELRLTPGAAVRKK